MKQTTKAWVPGRGGGIKGGGKGGELRLTGTRPAVAAAGTLLREQLAFLRDADAATALDPTLAGPKVAVPSEKGGKGGKGGGRGGGGKGGAGKGASFAAPAPPPPPPRTNRAAPAAAPPAAGGAKANGGRRRKAN